MICDLCGMYLTTDQDLCDDCHAKRHKKMAQKAREYEGGYEDGSITYPDGTVQFIDELPV